MSDSWPAPPPGDDASDSLSGRSLEVERALRALEAVDVFRAEAAALRAELQAARAGGYGRPRPRLRRRNAATSDLGEGTWRLLFEVIFLIGIAFVAWAVDLSRAEIVLVMAGAWLVVAVFEALASRHSEAAWMMPALRPPPMPARPQAVVQAPPPPAPPPPAPPPVAAPEGWPTRPETQPVAVEPPPAAPVPPPEPVRQAEPEPEPEPVAEPVPEQLVLLGSDEDGGPLVGQFAVLAERSAALDRAKSRRRFRLRLFRRTPDAAEPAEQIESEAEPEPDPAFEPFVLLDENEDGGPMAGPFAALEERSAATDGARSRRRYGLRIFRRAPRPAEPDEPSEAAAEPEAEPEPESEPVAEPVFEPFLLLDENEDGGPMAGPFAALEEHAAAAEGTRLSFRARRRPRGRRLRMRIF